jgi:hypothetical protein
VLCRRPLQFTARGAIDGRGSTCLGCPPPIFAWTNYWDLIDLLQFERISFDADQRLTLAGDCGAPDRCIHRVPAYPGPQIGRCDNHGHATKKRGDVSCDQHRRIKRYPHFAFRALKTSSSGRAARNCRAVVEA